MRKNTPLVTIITLALVLSACQLPFDIPFLSPAEPSEPTPSDDSEPSEPSLTPEDDMTPSTPEDEESTQLPPEPGEIVLTVWTTGDLAPSADTPGGQVLLEQLATFDETFPDIRVDVLPKRTTGPGSTLSYLRTAPSIAPGVLPDLTLLDRESLVQAARDDLVVPIGPFLDTSILSELYTVAGNLGTVDEELVGLPYVLEVQHAIYRQTLFRDPPVSFEAVLESPVPFVFPAGALGGSNHTLLTQYVAAGGELVDEGGEPYLDPAILSDVLSFYADAHEAGVIDPALFQHTDPTTTWAMYRDGQAALAVTTSTLYLSERDRVRSTGLMSIPTLSGDPHALATGWSWVMVTQDPERQAAAMQLVNFLMDPTNQGAYTQAANWLPSQRAALAIWGSGNRYTDFGNTLLNNAQPFPDTAIQSVVGAAIQDALEDVLLNGVSPIQAANQAAQAVNPAEVETPL